MIREKRTLEDLFSDPKLGERLKERLYSKKGLLGKESLLCDGCTVAEAFQRVSLALTSFCQIVAPSHRWMTSCTRHSEFEKVQKGIESWQVRVQLARHLCDAACIAESSI